MSCTCDFCLVPKHRGLLAVRRTARGGDAETAGPEGLPAAEEGAPPSEPSG